MAVAFDAASTPYVAVGGSLSVTTSLVVAQSNSCIVVNMGTKGAAGISISAVYANGIQLTQLKWAEVQPPNSGGIIQGYLFVTPNPVAAGTYSISANLVGSTPRLMGIIAASYNGQRTDVSPFSAVATTSAGNVTNSNFSFSSGVGSMAVIMGNCTTNCQSNTTQRGLITTSWGQYLGDTAGVAPSFSHSASMSITGQTNFGQLWIGLNIQAPPTLKRAIHNRVCRDVGF